MHQLSERPSTIERRPSAPLAATAVTRTRQAPTIEEGCPCCGATMNAVKPFVAMSTNSIVYKNRSVRLERNEALLAQKLAQRMPAVVAHDSLIGHVWGGDEPEDARGCIKQHVHHLRRKLRPLGIDIVNIFTVGYRMVML